MPESLLEFLFIYISKRILIYHWNYSHIAVAVILCQTGIKEHIYQIAAHYRYPLRFSLGHHISQIQKTAFLVQCAQQRFYVQVLRPRSYLRRFEYYGISAAPYLAVIIIHFIYLFYIYGKSGNRSQTYYPVSLLKITSPVAAAYLLYSPRNDPAAFGVRVLKLSPLVYDGQYPLFNTALVILAVAAYLVEVIALKLYDFDC